MQSIKTDKQGQDKIKEQLDSELQQFQRTGSKGNHLQRIDTILRGIPPSLLPIEVQFSQVEKIVHFQKEGVISELLEAYVIIGMNRASFKK